MDLAAERALSELLVGATGVLSSAHDVSDGGLAQTLVESCLRHGVGARVELPTCDDAFVALFSESAARAVVTVAPEDEERLFELPPSTAYRSPRWGRPAATRSRWPVSSRRHCRDELRAAWTATLPAALT